MQFNIVQKINNKLKFNLITTQKETNGFFFYFIIYDNFNYVK